jgi:hypothetical protein
VHLISYMHQPNFMPRLPFMHHDGEQAMSEEHGAHYLLLPGALADEVRDAVCDVYETMMEPTVFGFRV